MNIELDTKHQAVDTRFKLIAIERASARGGSALAELLDALDDPSPVVANAAASSLHGIAPMAALPERWHDDLVRAAPLAGVPAWLNRLCTPWGGGDDLPSLAARRALALEPGQLDRFLERLALFPGAQRRLYRILASGPRPRLARAFLRKLIALRRIQFPQQVSLSTTMACQLRCDFCIAEDDHSGSGRPMTPQDLASLADWMSLHGIKRLSLTGGEPTLYSGFGALLTELRSRSIELNVATNGIFSDAIRQQIIDAAPLCVTMHCAPEVRGPLLDTYTRNARGFTAAGVYTVLRCNITDPRADYRRFITAAIETGIREIRMAVPMPNAYRVNRHATPDEFTGYRDLIGAFVSEARGKGLETRLSKPFPPCLLDEATARVFLGNGSYSTNCPVHLTGFTNNLVIYPDLSYSPCLGLNAKVKQRITDLPGLRAAALPYRKAVEGLMRQTLFEHCPACPLSQGARCVGACLSYRPSPASFFA
ncbi:MAG: radical SAM protein [Nitrospirota bacterium]